MIPAANMCRRDMENLLIDFYDYDYHVAKRMTDVDLEDTVNDIITEFESSELKEKMDESCLIDLDDDESSLLDILTEWEDVCDDSDMYPNGHDDD